jgi:hypothetical protein
MMLLVDAARLQALIAPDRHHLQQGQAPLAQAPRRLPRRRPRPHLTLSGPELTGKNMIT